MHIQSLENKFIPLARVKMLLEILRCVYRSHPYFNIYDFMVHLWVHKRVHIPTTLAGWCLYKYFCSAYKLTSTETVRGLTATREIHVYRDIILFFYVERARIVLNLNYTFAIVRAPRKQPPQALITANAKKKKRVSGGEL